jgi:hypothetical protein
MRDKQPLTLQQAVGQVLAQVDGPLAMDELFRQVLTLRPSKAKKPTAALRNHVRWNEAGKTLVFLDAQTVLPLRVAMRGVRFRIPLSPQEAKRGGLFIHPAFDYFLPRQLDPAKVQLLDPEGHPLPVRVVSIQEKVRSVFGTYVEEHNAFDLGGWFRANRIQRDDSVLVTIGDWDAARLRLEHEPAGRRRESEIEQKDRELADLLFAMLEDARDERLYTHVALLTAYARLSDPRGYPGSHWIEVIGRDSRMKYDGFAIHYSDFRSPLEAMFYGEETTPEESFSLAQGRQVYRFRAALWHRPGLWRTLEIQGKQTLGEFDAILRDAFGHDPTDHLGGFWKLVRRGKSKRFRQVDLGDVEPFGVGSGAERRIAGLGLRPGDELKYVYDFGDWIEHRVALEEIVEPEARAEYPRIVARNEPQYRDCQACLARGRKARATWICIECSDRQQKDVLLCEKCLNRAHEEHYAEEILY